MNSRDCCIVLRFVVIHPRLCQRKGGVAILDNIIDWASCDLVPRAASLDLYCFVCWLLLGSGFCGALSPFLFLQEVTVHFHSPSRWDREMWNPCQSSFSLRMRGEGCERGTGRVRYTSLFPWISLFPFIVCSLSVIPLSLTFRTA